MAASPRLFLDALAHWVWNTPDKTCSTFLSDSGSPVASLTFKQLDLRTAQIAQHLAGLGLAKGDRCLLVFEPSLGFIVSFIACLKAQIIAVPVFPPDPLKKAVDLTMFATIAGDCGALTALTSSVLLLAASSAGFAMPSVGAGAAIAGAVVVSTASGSTTMGAV